MNYTLARKSRNGTYEYFIASSAYNCPEWVPLSEATRYPTADLAQIAVKHLWKNGVFEAKVLPNEVDPFLDDPATDDPQKPGSDMIADKQSSDDSGKEKGLCPDCDCEPCECDEDEPKINSNKDDKLDEAKKEKSNFQAGVEDGKAAAEAGDPNAFEGRTDLNVFERGYISGYSRHIKGTTKKEVEEAVNHMGEREQQTYSGWKRACRKAHPDCTFRGDKDIGGAVVDGKDVGEWDGTVGSVYNKDPVVEEFWFERDYAKRITNEGYLWLINLEGINVTFGEIIKFKWEGQKMRGIIGIAQRAGSTTHYLNHVRPIRVNESFVMPPRPKNDPKTPPTVSATTKVEEIPFKDDVRNGDKEEQSLAGEPEEKIAVPGHIKSQLKAVVNQFAQDAKAAEGRDGTRSSFCLTVADALNTLHDYLASGTVEAMKQAQIFMTKLMSPIMNHIPSDVINFVASGGVKRSLKDHFNSKWDKVRADK